MSDEGHEIQSPSFSLRVPSSKQKPARKQGLRLANMALLMKQRALPYGHASACCVI
jgi:hypothetical protein